MQIDPGSVVAVVFAILMILTHILKSIRENAEAAKRQQQSDSEKDEVVIVRPNKPVNQQPKPNKLRLADGQPSQGLRSVFDAPKAESPRQKALVKTLAPQGEGHRFVTDPGTLDAASIVSPTIDPTVKANLGSMTGIYEQQSAAARAATRQAAPTVEVHLLDILKRPEGICQAVILAEIMNRPAWIDAER